MLRTAQAIDLRGAKAPRFKIIMYRCGYTEYITGVRSTSSTRLRHIKVIGEVGLDNEGIGRIGEVVKGDNEAGINKLGLSSGEPSSGRGNGVNTRGAIGHETVGTRVDGNAVDASSRVEMKVTAGPIFPNLLDGSRCDLRDVRIESGIDGGVPLSGNTGRDTCKGEFDRDRLEAEVFEKSRNLGIVRKTLESKSHTGDGSRRRSNGNRRLIPNGSIVVVELVGASNHSNDRRRTEGARGAINRSLKSTAPRANGSALVTK